MTAPTIGTAVPAADDLKAAARLIEDLRAALLFDSDALDSHLAPTAEEHALIALSLLEQAHRHMRLAQYEQTRALASGSRDWP